MNTRPGELELTEPERYELHEGPFYHFEISRREFVHVLGAGVLISVAVPGVLAQRAGRGEGSSNLAQRLHLGADGAIASISIGAGGVAATPVRARQTQASLAGRQWSQATAMHAADALRNEFQPISDMRASNTKPRV